MHLPLNKRINASLKRTIDDKKSPMSEVRKEPPRVESEKMKMAKKVTKDKGM